MKLTLSVVTLLALGWASAAAAAQSGYSAPSQPPVAQQQPAQTGTPAAKLTVSKQALAAIGALQQAVKAKDTATLGAKIAAAEAVAQTKEDRYIIGQLQVSAALEANDLTGLAAGVDRISASQYLDSEKVSALYRDLGVRQFNAKQRDLAATSFQKSLNLSPNNAESAELLGQTMLAAGRPSEAFTTLQRAIQARSATGQKASEEIYRKAVQAAVDAKSPGVNDIARAWLLAYPSPSAWRNTLVIYRNSADIDADGTLALLRLMRATGGLTSAGDYRGYISLAVDQSNFNEAQTVLDEAIAAKAIDPASADNTFVAAVRGKPKASAADLAAAAKTAQSGLALLKIGDRFYGLGDYAKAAELYRQAQARGVDAAAVNLAVGIALARAGDKAGATAALNAVTGPRSAIAKYWLLYLQQRG